MPPISPTQRYMPFPVLCSRWILKQILLVYLRVWHNARLENMERIPRHGPMLALFNHASSLDVVGLLAVGPPDEGVVPAKESLFRVPVMGGLLAAWGAVPVERDGRDVAGLRALLGALRRGRIVAVAVEGHRSRDGRFGSISPVVARMAVAAQVPLLPMVFVHTFDAMPPGARFPRRRPITIRLGEPFMLPRQTSTEDAAQKIREVITALLPPDQQPLNAPLLAPVSAAPAKP